MSVLTVNPLCICFLTPVRVMVSIELKALLPRQVSRFKADNFCCRYCFHHAPHQGCHVQWQHSSAKKWTSSCFHYVIILTPLQDSHWHYCEVTCSAVAYTSKKTAKFTLTLVKMSSGMRYTRHAEYFLPLMQNPFLPLITVWLLLPFQLY